MEVMATPKRRLVWLAVVATAMVVGAAAALFPHAAVAPPVAQAKKPKPVEAPCAKRLLHDWADGRIDGTYPVSCYRNALKSLPSDLSVYSSAPDDIKQALSQRIVQSSRSKARRAAG
jgi:hypothetical protein